MELEENELDRNRIQLVLVNTASWFAFYFVVRFLVMNVFYRDEKYYTQKNLVCYTVSFVCVTLLEIASGYNVFMHSGIYCHC
jgi:hypothetical protein